MVQTERLWQALLLLVILDKVNLKRSARIRDRLCMDDGPS